MAADEGNLKIGATVDTAQLNEGFTSVQDLTQKVTQKLAVSFEECSSRTKAAMRSLSEDVKAAADSVSAESLKVAEATKAQTAALADLRRAQTISKDASLDEASTTALLAAAQQKAATSSAMLAEAKRAEGAAVSGAAEEVGLSSNFIVAAFQRAEAAVSESLAGMRERLILTGETAHLSARDMMGAFSGLGELLGVGMLAGIGGHYLDELAKMQVELGHLRVETGLNVTSLAGLQEIVKEMGGEWEPVEKGLVRLNRAMAEAQEGMSTYKRAFTDIGITMEELKGKTPEGKLQMVATAFAHTANTERTADAALTLFGRGGIELIPVLKEQGAQLEANMKKMGDLTGVTDQTVEASERWQRDTARLSTQFRSLMMPVLEHAGDVISGVAGAFEAAAFVIVESFELIGASVVSVGQAIYGFGKILFDATTGNLGAIAGDWEHLRSREVQNWKGAFADIADGWQEVASRFKAPLPEPPLPQGVDPGDLTPDGKPRGAGKAHDHAFQKDENDFNAAQLVALKQGHQLTLEEEINFWKARLDKAREGSDEYEKILAKLAHLETEQARQKKPAALETTSDDSGLKRAEQEFIESNEAQVHSTQEAVKQEIEAYREARAEEERIAQAHFQDVEEDSEFEVRMGRMTQRQRIAELKEAAKEEEQIRLQAVRATEMVDMQNAQKYQQDLNRELQITRELDKEIKKLNQEAALQTEKAWEQAFNKMTSEFNQATVKWLETGRGFQKSLETMWNGIAENFVKNIMKMTEQYLLGLLLQKAGQKSQIEADAKTAAANTYSAVSAIPVVGPFLAPPAAAAAFGAVMAFESFNAGGVVTGGNGAHVPVLAKAGERVLSTDQTQKFESMVNSSTSSSSNKSFHLHYQGQVNAYDRSGMRGALKGHAGDILEIVRQGMKDGAFA